MRKMHRFILTFAMALCSMATMAQNGFNYQAVIRDANGNLLAEQDIALRITLTTESGNQTYYQEMQTVRSNAYGAVSVVVGEGRILSGNFSNVPWNSGNVYMKTEFDPTGVGTDDLLVTIGTTKLQSVPVAEYAKKTGEVENPTNIKIQATATTGDEEALFEVKDNDGKVVFAVYKNGVRVYVDENDSKAAKSGFAVAGKSGKDGTESQYFSVNASGTKVYVDDDTVTTNGKAAKAKFAVAGKSGKANANTDYFAVNGYGTQVYVDDENSKAAKAKFAVAGKSGKADGNGNLLVVNQSGTKVYVDDDTVTTNGKAAKAKFAVAGKSGKANANTDYFAVNGYGTQVYVDDTASGKAAKAKFAVAGKSGKADGNLLVVNEAGTKVFVDDSDTKAAKATFAVAGKSGKGVADNYFVINDEGTKVFIDGVNGEKAAKATFAVASVRSGKAETAEDFFLINKDGTKVFIDEETHNNKAAKATFAVASVKKGKDGNQANINPNYLIIDSDSTRVYIDNSDAKALAAKSGFAVAGKSGGKGNGVDILKVTPDSTRVYVTGGNNKSGFGVEGKEGASVSGKNGFAVSEKGVNGNVGYMNVSAENFFAGYDAGKKTTSDGIDNTFVGNNAGIANTSGACNVFMGKDAGYTNTTSKNNVFIGNMAGYKTDGGTQTFMPYNPIIGNYESTPEGSDNVFLGHYSGYSNTIGNMNVFIGTYAGIKNTKGKSNVFIGQLAGQENTIGQYNVAVGSSAGKNNTVSSNNVFLGVAAGCHTNGTALMNYFDPVYGRTWTAYDGSNNVFIGNGSGYWNKTGSSNVYIGIGAGCDNETGSNNVFIGREAGFENESGSNNVFIGNEAGRSYVSADNKLFIANTADKTLIHGDFSSDYVIINGYSNNDLNFYVNGSAGGSNSWNTTSDGRLKKDVQTLDGALDKVLKLRGVSYYWKNKEEMAAAKGVPADKLDYGYDSKKHIGVIAQELEQEFPEIVHTSADGFKSVEYSTLTPILIEAMKEQQTIIEQQNKRIENLEKMLEELLKKQ